MKIIIPFLLVLFSFQSLGQELNCQVTIITDKKLALTSVQQDVLKQLEEVIYDFMNNTKWTNDQFEVEERINCNLQFQIKEIPSDGIYKGFLQVQSSRPALNSSYNSAVLNIQDDNVTIAFSRNSIISYAPNQFRDNLTSVLAYYANLIIGMDYDSFSSNGGTKYFSEAQNIVTLAQNSGYPGWKSNEKGRRNRFWIVDNILNEVFSPLRQCNYNYHRKGVDALHKDVSTGRKAMYNALSGLTKLSAIRPNSINLVGFVQAKRNEIKNLYTDAETREKQQMVNLLKRIDPSNSSKYQEILN